MLDSNFDALAQQHTVYAIDVVGFGRSSRLSERHVRKVKTAEDAETFFVDILEEWRIAMGLRHHILLGMLPRRVLSEHH